MLNRMVQQTALDRAFNALADGNRRDVLHRLGGGALPLSELATAAGMTVTGMAKHIHVLEAAGLVRTEKVGRTRRCSLGGERLDDVMAWIDHYQSLWERRLDGLDAYFTLEKGTER